MTIYINGTTGISGVDGSAGTPAFQGTDTNTGISFGSDVIIGSTGGVERFRLNASGVLAVGNSSSTRFEVAAGVVGVGERLHSYTNNYYIWGLRNENNDLTIESAFGGNIVFRAKNDGVASSPGTATERARIDSSGRLLVGTSSAVSVFGTNSDTTFYKASGTNITLCRSDSLANGDFVAVAAGTSTRNATIASTKHSGITNPCAYLGLVREDATNSFLWTDNSGNFRISSDPTHIGTTSGTVVGTQTSDERIKNVLGPVEYGLETLKQIEPVRFSLKSEPETEKLGFIAQQVQSLVPQSVFDTGEHIEGEPEDAPTKLGMEYASLIPVLVNAIKELSTEVDALKAQLQTS
jgi:hypothetical protein